MLSAALPWNVLSSRVGVGVLTEGWTLDTVRTEDNDARTVRMASVLSTTFSPFPVIPRALTACSLAPPDSSRLILTAENIPAKRL